MNLSLDLIALYIRRLWIYAEKQLTISSTPPTTTTPITATTSKLNDPTYQKEYIYGFLLKNIADVCICLSTISVWNKEAGSCFPHIQKKVIAQYYNGMAFLNYKRFDIQKKGVLFDQVEQHEQHLPLLDTLKDLCHLMFYSSFIKHARQYISLKNIKQKEAALIFPDIFVFNRNLIGGQGKFDFQVQNNIGVNFLVHQLYRNNNTYNALNQLTGHWYILFALLKCFTTQQKRITGTFIGLGIKGHYQLLYIFEDTTTTTTKKLRFQFFDINGNKSIEKTTVDYIEHFIQDIFKLSMLLI